jgi:hypothetical protein
MLTGIGFGSAAAPTVGNVCLFRWQTLYNISVGNVCLFRWQTLYNISVGNVILSAAWILGLFPLHRFLGTKTHSIDGILHSYYHRTFLL